MVRLLVPEGEGQHDLTTRQSGALAVENGLVSTPAKSAYLGLAVTGFLALVGRSQPGTYLKAVAYISVLGVSAQACEIYGRHELNKGVLKMEDINAKPSKLWERTRHWTVEDATLSGGALGLLLAVNPGALPGVRGWRRFLGATVVGMGVGYTAAQPILCRVSPALLSRIQEQNLQVQHREYTKLSQNENAKNTLSRPGKIALWWYTDPKMQTLFMPLLWLASRNGDAAVRNGAHHAHEQQTYVSPNGLVTQHGQITAADGPTLSAFAIDNNFKYPETSANFTINWKDQDPKEVMERYHKAQEQANETENEFNWLWSHTQIWEAEINAMADNDPEKSVRTRQLQLMSNLTRSLFMQARVCDYMFMEARSRLFLMAENGVHSDTILPMIYTAIKADDGTREHASITAKLRGNNRDGEITQEALYEWGHSARRTQAQEQPLEYHVPYMVAHHVRTMLSEQKKMLAGGNELLGTYQGLDAIGKTYLSHRSARLKRHKIKMMEDVETMEALLTWIEEQVQSAEEKRRLLQQPSDTEREQ
ncbi:hypothetical protein ACN47E_010148 [Coniothyrium glycines]